LGENQRNRSAVRLACSLIDRSEERKLVLKKQRSGTGWQFISSLSWGKSYGVWDGEKGQKHGRSSVLGVVCSAEGSAAWSIDQSIGKGSVSAKT
jgi:hypothetical protein